MRLSGIAKILGCIGGITLLALSPQASSGQTPAAARDRSLEWAARLYSSNDDYAAVIINTRALPRNVYIAVDTIEITCFFKPPHSKNQVLTPAEFGDQFSTLHAGNKYQGFFKHGCQSAQRIKGVTMHFHEFTLGMRAPHVTNTRTGSRKALDDEAAVSDLDAKPLGEAPKSKRPRKGGTPTP